LILPSRALATDESLRNIIQEMIADSSGAIAVEDDHFFSDETDRDTFFSGITPEEGTFVVITDNPVILQKYIDGQWVDVSVAIRGRKGDKGDPCEAIVVGYDVSQSYSEGSSVIEDNVLYVAKQAVPAGTPVMDTDYWSAVTRGDFIIKVEDTEI
jgi:hypothetical protein